MRPVALKGGGLAPIVLLAVILWIFWPVTDHPFINYDDPDYITENPHVRAGLTPAGIRWALTSIDAGNWHPLTWLSHMTDVSLFGLDPGGHHFMGLLLHAAGTLALFALLRTMTGAVWRSVLASALFALHPLHVESVAWAAERKDVLSGLLGMLTLWAYARYAGRPAIGRYLPVLICFALGLTAKPMLVTLPLVMLLLDAWPLQRFSLSRDGGPRPLKGILPLIGEKTPLLLLSVAAGMVTVVAQHAAGAMGPISVYTLHIRLGNALVAYAAYLVKTLWPVHLGIFYPHPGMPPAWQVAGSAAVLGLISILSVRHVRRRPYLLVGWLWYLITLLPVIGLIQVGAQAMADRYTYLPLIGIFVACAWAAGDLAVRWPLSRWAVWTTAAAVLVAACLLTRQQLALWRDEIVLYRHTLAITAESPTLLNNLGLAVAQRDGSGAAIPYFTRVLAMDPAHEEALNNLGNALLSGGAFGKAMTYYRRALAAHPNAAATLLNMGLAFKAQGQIPEALDCLNRALALAPGLAEAHHAIGNIRSAQGAQHQAAAHYRAAIARDSTRGEFHYNLGVSLEKLGKASQALESYRAAVALSPGLRDAHNNLGNLLLGQGRAWEAAEHYQQAIGIDPGFAEAYYNMGVALEHLGKTREAVVYYLDALRINPGEYRAHVNAASAFLKIGDRRAAAKHYRMALDGFPEGSEARKKIARILDALR